MSIDNSNMTNIIPPVSVKAGLSKKPRASGVFFYETFTEEFREKLPNGYLLEIQGCYKTMEGRSLGLHSNSKPGSLYILRVFCCRWFALIKVCKLANNHIQFPGLSEEQIFC